MNNRRRRNHSNKFKEEDVKLVTELGYSIAETARKLGVNANLLGRWKKEIKQPDDGAIITWKYGSKVSRAQTPSKR